MDSQRFDVYVWDRVTCKYLLHSSHDTFNSAAKEVTTIPSACKITEVTAGDREPNTRPVAFFGSYT